jgi:acetyltransferase-like isoleucine patch superfamily enzyme/O-antigen/teichoic acid export membrane protein
LLTSLGSTFGALHTAAQRLVYPAVGAVIEKGLDALVIILLLQRGAGVRAAALVLLGGALAGAIWQAAWFARLIGLRYAIDGTLMRDLIRGGLPFLTYGMLGVIYYRLDALLLRGMTNIAVVGWYGAGYRLFDTLVFLPNIVMMAVLYPLMSRYSVSSEASLKVAIEKATNLLLICGLPIAAGMLVAAPNIVGFMYHRAEFAPTVNVLRALAPGVVLLYVNAVWTTALMSVKREKALPLLAGVALVVNLGGNLVLIPRLLGVGAALMTSLTEGVLCGMALALLPHQLLPVGSLRVGARALAASLVMAGVVLALNGLALPLLLLVAGAVYVLAAMVLHTIPRSDLDMLYRAVRRKARGESDAPAALQQGASTMTISLTSPQNGIARQSGAPWVRALFDGGSHALVRWYMTRRPLRTLWSVGELSRKPPGGARRWLAAVVKYLTNSVIAQVPSYTVRHGWYRRMLGWYIGPGATILMGQQIQMAGIRTSGKRVSIGADTVINHGCLLYTTGGLVIGEHVSISSGVWLVTGTHLIDAPDFPAVYRPITIDDYAWIGARATILGGVTIGRGAVVMAGAMVTRDVAPYAVVGGVPARVVATRQLRTPAYTLNFHPLLE